MQPKVLAIAVENGDMLKKLGDVLGLDLTNIQTVGSVDADALRKLGLNAVPAQVEAEEVEFGDQISDENTDDYTKIVYNAKDVDPQTIKITKEPGIVKVSLRANDGDFAEDEIGVEYVDSVEAKLDDNKLTVTVHKLNAPVEVPVMIS